jgi:serine/threonine protein kinase
MTSITVTQKTTLSELQTFAQAAGGNDKIRAKRNDDGSFTLYASSKDSTGVKNFFTEQRADRRTAAREAVEMVLTAVKGSHVDQAMGNVLQGLPQTGELRGATLQNLLTQAASARQQGAAIAIPDDGIAQLLQDAVKSGNPDAIEAATAKLADKTASLMRARPQDQQLDFVTSRGEGVKSAILGQLVDMLDDPGAMASGKTYEKADPIAQQVLDAAYDRAVQNLSNRRVDANTIRLDDPTSPTGYTDYTKDRHLADGGYGSIDAYRAADGREVVVKSPILGKKDKAADKFEEAAKEITAHRAATAGQPGNVMGLTTALRTADGGLELVMPLMPNGNAHDMGEKMHKLKDGAILQPREATMGLLTTLRDMGRGTAQLQANGVVSLDNKSMNVLIDGNGVGHLSDFGTAAAGGNVRSLGSRMVANPTWLAPETIQGWDNRSSQMTAMEAQHKADRQAAVTALKNAGMPPEQRAVVLSDLTKQQAAREEGANRFNVTEAADTWSFGVDFYKLLTNQFPFEDRFFTGIEDQLKAHALFGGQVSLPTDVDLGLTPAETREANRLLAGLLNPDPTQRMTINQALQSPLFALPEVGSQASRDNIKLAAQS